MRRINWPLWLGFLLAVLAFFSYYGFLAQFPITRDVPWVSFLLLLVAVVLLVTGWRRAQRKVLASIVALLGLLVTGMFTFMVTAGSKGLPVSSRAPAIGRQAPAFTLPDTQNRPVALNDLLQGSNGVLLVFYRGYW
jgi:energy-coupling factor transporter transmembrane protein EcfT